MTLISTVFLLVILDTITPLNITDIIFFRSEEIILGTPDGSYNLARLQSFTGGIKIFFKNPFLGIGINNLNRTFISETTNFVYASPHAAFHSKFIMILIENGILGFITFTVFALSSCLRKFNIKSFFNLPKNISFSFFTVFILFGFMGSFGTYFFFWFLAALSVNYNYFTNVKEKELTLKNEV